MKHDTCVCFGVGFLKEGTKMKHLMLVFCCIAALVFCSQAISVETEVEEVLESLLYYAKEGYDSMGDLEKNKAAFDKYFALYANDSVFLGTDPHETFTNINDFKENRKYPNFGWQYSLYEPRHIYVKPDLPGIAWHDEILEGSKPDMGVPRYLIRVTGVLKQQEDKAWKVEQRSMSLLVPNKDFATVIKLISGDYEKDEL
eukprot:GCRY01000527.1.p1 GENE.GCRY01000527.1~~GCRY01000527.1.p1  ORF type:complete len:200 (-),score=29.90 GCRY01000527.1:94-693(-)